MPADRIFISVRIPMTGEIADIIGKLRTVENVRTVSEKQMHITLKFLGDTDVSKIPKLCSELRNALSETPGFDLTVKGMGGFPDERNPRVVWLGFEKSDELVKLADAVEGVLSSMGLQYDGKKFSPHVTIGRTSGRTQVFSAIKENKDKVFCKFRCSSVEVMKSELTPKGAKHSAIDSIDLL